MPTERNIQDASDNQEIDLENRKCDWSEHISSSGKKYYYNYRTEVSQWEKPKELSEWECKHLPTDRNRDFAEASSSSQPYTDYHHSSYQINEGHPNSSCQNQTVVSHPKSHRTEDAYFQDMDISSDATPTSSPLRRTLAEIQPAQITTEQQQPVAVSLAQLPKLLCRLTRRENADLNPREALQTLKTALLISCQINNANITNPSQVAAHNDDVNSPIVDYNHDSPGGDSPTSSAASLHSYNTSPLFPQPQTPSFANYYKPHLISHVTGWQAEFVEEQANRYSMDAHNFANQNYTWITANLKMCRSQVRVSEIRATVQQQRVLFLRQQIKELEDLKSQNSFMSSSA